MVALFRPQLETLAYEECWAVYLTSSNRIIERQRSRRSATGMVEARAMASATPSRS